MLDNCKHNECKVHLFAIFCLSKLGNRFYRLKCFYKSFTSFNVFLDLQAENCIDLRHHAGAMVAEKIREGFG